MDDEAGREKCVREARCRVTGSPDYDRHHLVPRSLGGDDVDVNIVPLDHEWHMHWHHTRGGKLELGPLIWARLHEPERAYVLAKKGPVFVERYYGVTEAT